METIQLINQEEQLNLRIVEHLDMSSLPEPLQQMLSLATTPEEEPWQSSLRFFSDDPCDEPLLYGPPLGEYEDILYDDPAEQDEES